MTDDEKKCAVVLGEPGYIPPKETAWVHRGIYLFARRLRSPEAEAAKSFPSGRTGSDGSLTC